MSFSVHTFEINPGGNNLGFAFHQKIEEGREVYFLGKFKPDTVDAGIIAEDIFGRIVDGLQASLTMDQYEAFELSMKAANEAVKKSGQKLGNVPEIVIAYFDFNHLYLTQSGEAEAYLLRDDSLSQISEPGRSNEDLFSYILSGNVAVQDTIVLGSTRLLRAVTTTQFTEIFQRSDFDDSVSQLRHTLMNGTEEDMLVTVIGIGKKSNSGPAAFLSKMVSKITPEKKAALATSETIVAESEEMNESSTDATTESVETLQGLDEAPIQASEFTKKDTSILGKIKEQTVSLTDFVRPFIKKVSIDQWKKIIGGLAALTILFLGINFVSNYESEADSVLRAELQVARQSLIEADTLLIQGDREQAAVLIEKARKSAQTVLSSKTKTFRFDAQTLLTDVQEKQLSVENAKKVSPELVADLSLKNDNVSGLGVLALQNNSYVYDSKRIYKTVRNIVERGLKVSDSEVVLAGAARPDQKTLTFLTDAPRVVEMRNGSIAPMSTTDETWKSGIDIKNFGARFLYVLDPLSNQIWKYTRKSSSYGGAVAYSSGVDLSRSIGMAIDGAIYVLSDDGTLHKLFRGDKIEYGFRNLPSVPFSGKDLKIFTSIEHDYLYVLDPANTRILIFDKGERFATYKKQVIFEDLAGVRDFYIDVDEQKATIITADKLYEFGL